MEEKNYQLDLLKAQNAQLSKSERIYRLVCESSDYGFIYQSLGGEELLTFGSFESMFGLSLHRTRELDILLEKFLEEDRRAILETINPEDYGREFATCECRLSSGHIWYRIVTRIEKNDEGVFADKDKVVTFMNITREKAQHSDLLYMAYYDTTTGIYNRNYFVSLLTEFIARADRDKCRVSLLMIDIDDFKKINDVQGIIIGDELLQQVGFYLKGKMVKDRIICSHINNDIFCVAIYDATGPFSVENFYNDLKKRFSESFHMSTGQEISITASVGVAEYPDAGGSALDIINCADIVVYNCKKLGKNILQYFEAPILDDFLKNVDIENKLKEAAFNNNFMMYFQPQYVARTRRLRGVESLIRWKDDTGKMIPPSVFIPIAEKNGLIDSIGHFVVEESLRQYKKWSDFYEMHFKLSINISSLQYKKDDFVDSIMELIEKNSVDPSDVELEITESILIDDFDSVTAKLTRLRNFGVSISLDDFGTGYSSLSYLKKFPIDTLKVDKSFIDTVLDDASTRIITESILNMSHAMGFETIAEGVENERQFSYLASVGCDVIQGFYLGKPLPSEKIDELLSYMKK
ncbi:MAG: bifunctional diguanylate cyclase/phosphodiesterase [Lachnospiraceae bacterium]|nr:bifunctional diguanylate cyclase/phosphodiesterase [Lachnospiraceae bacterium]